MKKIREQLGMSLIEMALAVAITGLIVVPLTAIFGTQLRIPQKVAGDIAASRQIQKSTVVLIEDAQAAKSFTPGTGPPTYGTFRWDELAGPAPIPVSAVYIFKEADPDKPNSRGQMLRILARGGEVAPATIILDGITAYDQVTFALIPKGWQQTQDGKSFEYTDGKIVVTISQEHEAGAEFGDVTLEETLVADFRPHAEREVSRPVLSPIQSSGDSH